MFQTLCISIMKFLLLLIISCAYATALFQNYVNVEDSNVSIINGNNAKRKEYPYTVSVQENGKHRCGASIISQTWLVSAAHCYEPNLSTDITAVAGLLIQGENRRGIQTIPIERIVMHPEYNSVYSYNDIALLKLTFPLSFTDFVKAVGLPEPNANFSGEAVTLGWGQLGKDPIIEATILQYLKMDIITNAECNKRLAATPISATSWPYLVKSDKLCTLPQIEQSACHGDSGGPLVQNHTLVGIVHAGDTMCGLNLNIQYPNIFARVDAFIGFIQEYVKDIQETQ